MKKAIHHLGAATLLGAAATFAPLAMGQDAVTQTTTTTAAAADTAADGTITEFSPASDIVIRSDAGSTPVRYSYTKSTTVVDQNGAPVDISVVKTGIPVHVIYERDGDQVVARKIIVQHVTTEPQAVEPVVVHKDTTTTTTTQQDR
jgi:hypothetical protein